MLQRITKRSHVMLPEPSRDSRGRAQGLAAGITPWRTQLSEALPPLLRPHLLEVIEKAGELVLFVDSAAWAGRIRFALPDLEKVAAGRRLTVRLSQPALPRRGR